LGRLQALVMQIQTLRDEVVRFAAGAEQFASAIRDATPQVAKLCDEISSFTHEVAKFGIYAAAQRGALAATTSVTPARSAARPSRERTAAPVPDIIAPCGLRERRG
jgi:phage host-nuclease inhibitor protein Gam